MSKKLVVAAAICAVLGVVGYVDHQLSRPVIASDLFPAITFRAGTPPPVAQAATTKRGAALAIPKLQLTIPVTPVGIDKSGAMGVPVKSDQAGWFKHGPQPGQLGSAVIDGHYSLVNHVDGVFRHIDQLRTGDDLFFTDSAKVRHHFVVKSNEIYKTSEAPTKRIFGARDAARLNLITCAGKYDSATRTYTQRRVVYATLAH
jgi:LPXTG-site transpeptidase (sortase) family protein